MQSRPKKERGLSGWTVNANQLLRGEANVAMEDVELRRMHGTTSLVQEEVGQFVTGWTKASGFEPLL